MRHWFEIWRDGKPYEFVIEEKKLGPRMDSFYNLKGWREEYFEERPPVTPEYVPTMMIGDMA